MMVNPGRVAFTLFGRDIYWYGVFMAVGIILAIFIAMKEGKRKRLVGDTIIDMCLVVIPLGIVGARLYYVLFKLEDYLADPIRMLYIWEGGLAIYGAVLGGLLGAWLFARRRKVRYLKLLDCMVPGLVLAQAIGRWGNFFNQEAYGLPVTDPNLWWFPFAVKIDIPWNNGLHYFNGAVCDNPYHLATFFYESMWCLIIFIVIWLCRKRFRHDGDALWLYALLYSFERALVEPLRGDSLYIGDVRVSMLLSILAFAAVLAFLIVRAVKEKKMGALIWPRPEAAWEKGADEAGEGESEEDADREEAEADAADEAGEAEPGAAAEEEEAEPEPDALEEEPGAEGVQDEEGGIGDAVFEESIDETDEGAAPEGEPKAREENEGADE